MKIIFNTGYIFSERLWQDFLTHQKPIEEHRKVLEKHLTVLDTQNMGEDYTRLFVDKDPPEIGFKKL